MTGSTKATHEWEDPIVAEVRRARAEIFAEADHDLNKLCERLRESEKRSKHRLVKRAPRPVDELPEAVA
ncbi:MAG: hypothetical protein JXR96_09670 [Deltaproteobacteria bacterium]|nr:hypothetical protein [Deltaproteobacteria bacterium]